MEVGSDGTPRGSERVSNGDGTRVGNGNGSGGKGRRERVRAPWCLDLRRNGFRR